MTITINAGPTRRASVLGESILSVMDTAGYIDLPVTITITDTPTSASSTVVMDCTGTVTRIMGAEAIIRAMLTGPYSIGIAVVISNADREVQDDRTIEQAAQGLEEVKEIHRIIRHLREAEKAQAHDGMTVREARKVKLVTAKAHIDKLLAGWEGEA